MRPSITKPPPISMALRTPNDAPHATRHRRQADHAGESRPIDPETITDRFNRPFDRAGLPVIMLHNLRHSYATTSLRASVKPKTVSARLGHATVELTLDTYTADAPELHHPATETISDLFCSFDPPEDGPLSLPIDLP
jgi:integrase